ncbi:MAG: acyltransferase, partial [Solirubrobacteraceae bacterium]|nr:acyltransferase [Solirubrobacteraceae bacterium]
MHSTDASASAAPLNQTPRVGHDVLKDLEVLRAIAILLTLVMHLPSLLRWWMERPPAAYSYLDFRVGVDLFFVISGYVIAISFLGRLAAVRNADGFWRNVVGFWIRRAWRIWPSAWLWLLLIVISTKTLSASGAFGTPEILSHTVSDAIASFLQVMNWRLAEGVLTNSAKILPPNPALSIYWSLSLEEQFYLALPFIVLLTRHHLAKVLLVAVAVMFFVPKGVGSPAWFFRLDPIIWGVLMAFWRQHPSYTLLEPRFLARGKLRRVALTLAVPLLAAAVMGLNVVFFANSLVALICAALVYAG